MPDHVMRHPWSTPGHPLKAHQAAPNHVRWGIRATWCTCPESSGFGAGFERLSVEGRPQDAMRDMSQNPCRARISYIYRRPDLALFPMPARHTQGPPCGSSQPPHPAKSCVMISPGPTATSLAGGSAPQCSSSRSVRSAWARANQPRLPSGRMNHPTAAHARCGPESQRRRCCCSTIMSVANCSAKMSVHGRTDIDSKRTGSTSGAQRGVSRSGNGRTGGRDSGSE